jgi:transcriptional regulator with XRE-family HTH domain
MTVMTQPIPEWTLGWRLQRSLAHAGMSIDDMAAELGVSRQTVSRWVNDHVDPRLGYLKLWALRTGVPLGWLVDDGVISSRIGPGPDSLGAAA